MYKVENNLNAKKCKDKELKEKIDFIANKEYNSIEGFYIKKGNIAEVKEWSEKPASAKNENLPFFN